MNFNNNNNINDNNNNNNNNEGSKGIRGNHVFRGLYQMTYNKHIGFFKTYRHVGFK